MHRIWSGFRRLPVWAQLVLVIAAGATAWNLDAAEELSADRAAQPAQREHADARDDAGGMVRQAEAERAAPSAESAPSPPPPAGDDEPAKAGVQQRDARDRAIPAGAQRGVVERIVDGDTIWVRVDDPGGALAPNATHKIRLLEIDTPETVHPNQPVQCGGAEASDFAAAQMPVGSTVYLEADREDTDHYGRYLRYVYLPDGRMFNELAVRQGHAKAVLYAPNDRHIHRLRAAEAEARDARRGLWGSCAGDAAGAAGEADAPRANPPAPQPVVPQAPAGRGCDPNYRPCVPTYPPDVNCSGVRGPVTVVGADPHGLDGDGDGSACES